MSDLSNAIEAIRDGQLVVLPTDTTYAVFADAFNKTAITSLRIARSQAEHVALPVAAASLEMVSGVAKLDGLARDLATAFWPGALTVLTSPQPTTPLQVGGRDDALAIRVPHHDLASQVIQASGPVAFTGAHIVGQAPVTSIEAARAALGEAVAVYVDGGDLPGGSSTIVDATGSTLRIVRGGNLSIEQLRNVLPMIVDARASH